VGGTQFWQRCALAGGLILAILLAGSWRGLAGVMILAGVALAVLVILWALPGLLVRPIPDQELPPTGEPKDRLDAKDARLGRRNDLRNGMLQTLVVVGVLAGAWAGFQQLANDRKNADEDRKLTRQGQASERFTQAISQLGDKQPMETRIGGIYGLAQVTEQAPDNNHPVGEVLLAYINGLPRPRQPAKPSRSESAKPTLSEEAPDVQAALTVLTQYDTDEDGVKDYAWLSHRLNLERLNLRGADLRGADLRGADLGGTDLTDAKLNGADLSRTDQSIHRNAGVPPDAIPTTDLSGAHLHHADLRGANFTGADMTAADLTIADLQGAVLRGANLDIADLRGAFLRGADVCVKQANSAELDDEDHLGCP
jgi:hypothetical protein